MQHDSFFDSLAFQTLESTWGVSVLDHGGLLVAARDYHQDQSNALMYSCDEGGSWSSYTFYDQFLTIFGVITEPGETTTVVNLFGVESQQRGWEVVLVNFSQIFDRMCIQPQDYYSWSPYDEVRTTACVGNLLDVAGWAHGRPLGILCSTCTVRIQETVQINDFVSTRCDGVNEMEKHESGWA